MRGKTPSPNNNTASSLVVPLPDLLAQKPVGVSHPEPHEILDEVGDAVDSTLESTAAFKKLKTKLPSCLTEPEESAEGRKSALPAAAKPNEDDLMELLLSKKSKVQAMQRSVSLDEGGVGESKSRLERAESTPSSDVRTEKAMSKEKASQKNPGEKVASNKSGGKGEKMESKTVGRQPASKASDSFSKALGESDKMVSKKKAKKEKKNDVNEKHKKGTKERVYIDTEKARTSNQRNEVDPVKNGSERNQKENKVEKQKAAENALKGQKSNINDSLLTDAETIAKETYTDSHTAGGEAAVEDDDSDEIACLHCFVKFTLANYQGHRCEKKLESGELLAGQVEASVEGVESNSRKEGGTVVHSDDEPADEFAREGREKEERERCLKERKEEKDMREKETMEREDKENGEKERKKERKEREDGKEKNKKEDEKDKKKKGTEKELKRKEKKKKEGEREKKEGDEENDKKKSNQEEKNEKQEKESGLQQKEIEEMEVVSMAGDEDRAEVFQEKVQTGFGFGKTQENKEKGGTGAPECVSPQGDLNGDEEARLREGERKREGEGTNGPQRKAKRRRINRGQVMSLHKALGGSTSSEEEEVDEEPLSIWKGVRKLF